MVEPLPQPETQENEESKERKPAGRSKRLGCSRSTYRVQRAGSH